MSERRDRSRRDRERDRRERDRERRDRESRKEKDREGARDRDKGREKERRNKRNCPPDGRWNTKYEPRFYFLSDSEDPEEKEEPAEEQPPPPVAPSPEEAATRLDRRVAAVDSPFLVCVATQQVRDKYIRSSEQSFPAPAHPIFCSLVRKACMYYAHDIAREMLAFIHDFYEAAQLKAVDQVAGKYMEKVLAVLAGGEGGDKEGIEDLVVRICENRAVNSLSVSEFLKKRGVKR